jgi:hypothetical protein
VKDGYFKGPQKDMVRKSTLVQHKLVFLLENKSVWSRGLFQKLIVTQLFRKFSVFYGTPRLISVFTRAYL